MFGMNTNISNLPSRFKQVMYGEKGKEEYPGGSLNLMIKINNYLKERLKERQVCLQETAYTSTEIIKSMKAEVKEIRNYLNFTESLFDKKNNKDILNVYWRSNAYLENAEKIVACVEFLYKKITLLEQQECMRDKNS
jgi:hypothetical protein